MRHWKTWVAVGAVVLLAGAAVVVLRARGNASQSGSFTQVVTAQRGSLVAAISLTGEVSAERREQLSFDVNKIPLVEVNVSLGQVVRKGTVLARIDPSSLQRAVDQAEANLLSAEEALTEAKSPASELDRLKAGLAVAQAEVALDEANQALDELLNPDSATTQKTASSAAAQLEQAKNRLAALQVDSSTQQQLDRLQWLANIAEVEHGKLLEDPNPSEIARDKELLKYKQMLDAKDSLETAKARAALDLLNAQNNVRMAEEALAESEAGAESLALAQARNKVAQAEYNLAKAKDSLATLMAGPDVKLIKAAQASYDSAKATLEEAQATLESATMVAPFDGTVISVGAKVGDLVSAGTTVVTLADLSELQILAVVDETDIVQIKVGLEADITFDAFPGRRFKGKVLEVPLQARLVQNIVSYDVPLSIEQIEGTSLKSGMTANLKIVVGRRDNALLVPVLAVQQGEDGDVVIVEASPNGPTVELPVEVGLTDGTNVEVLSGLVEGDRVVIEYKSTQQQQGFGEPGFYISISPGELKR